MQIYWEIFIVALRLGLTSFGGPTAHLGYFQKEYVQRRKWLKDEQYADLVALAQFLPGPASSQVGIGIGLMRGKLLGALLAFLGFTLPSVIILIIFAQFLHATTLPLTWIKGLQLVAIAIVAQALIDMSKKLLPQTPHRIIACLAMLALLIFPVAALQLIIIILAAIAGFVLFQTTSHNVSTIMLSKKTGAICLLLFFSLLIILPVLAYVFPNEWLTLIEKFYRAGAFVFGGGHVVLPLLETQFVETGQLSSADFLAGYGVTQAMPGPLFTFAAYIGTMTNGVIGGIIATLAIFLPAFLLIVGALPFWQVLSAQPKLRGAIVSMNAAVVGILAAAFITALLIPSITDSKDILLTLVLIAIVLYAKQPPWITVLVGLIIGIIFY